MRAMVLDAPGRPLRAAELPDPSRGRGRRCSRCTVPGHQIVATVVADGERFAAGTRVGVPWLGWTDGTCPYCRSGRENLCDNARFTGYDRDGGYAELAVADERFCFSIPADYSDLQAAPLLCAGLIGYRALRMTGDAERLGLLRGR